MADDMHTPSIARLLAASESLTRIITESGEDIASISSYGRRITVEDSMRSTYLSRLLRICGVDEEGAKRLAQETPYSLADLAYADPRFVWKWCLRLGIELDKPKKRVISTIEMARIEKILMDARRNNRSYIKKKMERQS